MEEDGEENEGKWEKDREGRNEMIWKGLKSVLNCEICSFMLLQLKKLLHCSHSERLDSEFPSLAVCITSLLLRNSRGHGNAASASLLHSQMAPLAC